MHPLTPAVSQEKVQDLILYSDMVICSHRTTLKLAMFDIALHHALHRQLTKVTMGLCQMEELLQQKSQMLMWSLS
jgi:hypothetical protein